MNKWDFSAVFQGPERAFSGPLKSAIRGSSLGRNRGDFDLDLEPSCPALCRASTSSFDHGKTWMAGTGPAMTNERSR
ncbi:MAG: hypothetical protein JZU55_06565, partial [Afipia sp.]|nr:hypothetical protein [Afipia sp.]